MRMSLSLQVSQNLTLDQAIMEIRDLDKQATRLKAEQLRRKFQIGGIVASLDVPHGEREKALTKINLETGVHINQLREWARIYAHFGGSLNRLDEWMVGVKRPAEYMLRDLISANSDPSVLGEDRHAIRVTHRLERMANDIDEYNNLVRRGVVDREEAESLMSTISETLGEYRETSGIQKVRVRNEDYLNAVRKLPCAVTGQPGPSDPHHVMTGGVGMKGSDLSVIPLSRRIHQLVEDQGHAWLENEFGVRIGDLIAKTMHRVFTGQELEIP